MEEMVLDMFNVPPLSSRREAGGEVKTNTLNIKKISTFVA